MLDIGAGCTVWHGSVRIFDLIDHVDHATVNRAMHGLTALREMLNAYH